MHIQLIEVRGVETVSIEVSEKLGNLPPELNFDKAKPARPRLNDRRAILYDGSKNEPFERPIAFMTYGRDWTTEITVDDIPNKYWGKEYDLVVGPKFWGSSGTDYSSGWENVNSSRAIFKFPRSAITPRGIFGRFDFELRLNSSAESYPKTRIGDGGILLEAYALSIPRLPAYYNGKVPLLMLRMFVLPLGLQPVSNTIQSWISLVVNICHGSQKPFTGETSQTENHWLKYNSLNGAANFSGYYGWSGIDYKAWLNAYRNGVEYGAVTAVNCYDQAAITEVALGLGMHTDQLHWEYHQPYGFIDSTTQLVGWGYCNNPYFGNDSSKMKIGNYDRKRSPFRNHAYLSWSEQPMDAALYQQHKTLMASVTSHDDYVAKQKDFETKNNLKMYIIDSCGGPHIGNESRTDYEKQIQLVGDPRKSNYETVDYKDDWSENHYLGEGITKWGGISGSHGLLDEFTAALYGPTCDEILANLTNVAHPVSYTYTLDIGAMKAAFNKLVSGLAVKYFEATKTYDISPFETQNRTKVYETKTNYRLFGEKDQRLRWAISMRVAVNDTTAGVSESMAHQLAFLMLASDHETMEAEHIHGVPQKSGPNVPVVGSKHIRAMVFHNIAVEVFMDDVKYYDEYVFQPLLQTIEGMSKTVT